MLSKRKLSIVLKNFVYPLLVSLALVGSLWFNQEKFEEGYFVLMLLSCLLVVYVADPVDFESNNKVFWKKTVSDLLLQWFLVISLILLLGFTFKVTDYFSRKVLFYWFLTAPGVLVTAQWLARFFFASIVICRGREVQSSHCRTYRFKLQTGQ
jgi:hypothetical protein